MLQMGAHASLSVVKGCCPGKDVRYHSARAYIRGPLSLHI